MVAMTLLNGYLYRWDAMRRRVCGLLGLRGTDGKQEDEDGGSNITYSVVSVSFAKQLKQLCTSWIGTSFWFFTPFYLSFPHS